MTLKNQKNIKNNIYDPDLVDKRNYKLKKNTANSVYNEVFTFLFMTATFAGIVSIMYSVVHLSSVSKDVKLENPLVLTFGLSDSYWYLYAIPTILLILIALFKKDIYTIYFSIGLLILLGLCTYYVPNFIVKVAPEVTYTDFGKVKKVGDGVEISFNDEVISLPAVESRDAEGRLVLTIEINDEDYEFLKKVEDYNNSVPARE